MRASGRTPRPGSSRNRAARSWNSAPKTRRTSSARSLAITAVASIAMPLVITSRSPSAAPPLGLIPLGSGHPDHRPGHDFARDRGGHLGVPPDRNRSGLVAAPADPVGDLPDPPGRRIRGEEDLGEEPARLAAGGGHIVRVHDHRVPARIGARKGDRVGREDEPRLAARGGDRRVLAGRRPERDPLGLLAAEPAERFPEQRRRNLPLGERLSWRRRRSGQASLRHPGRVRSPSRGGLSARLATPRSASTDSADATRRPRRGPDGGAPAPPAEPSPRPPRHHPRGPGRLEHRAPCTGNTTSGSSTATPRCPRC